MRQIAATVFPIGKKILSEENSQLHGGKSAKYKLNPDKGGNAIQSISYSVEIFSFFPQHFCFLNALLQCLAVFPHVLAVVRKGSSELGKGEGENPHGELRFVPNKNDLKVLC